MSDLVTDTPAPSIDASVPSPAEPPAADFRAKRRHARDQGFALVWFALSLTTLLAMAGVAVDLWNWWYNGNQQQRAADSASLGGVSYLPGDPAAARAAALDIALANGLDASEVLIELSADDPTLDSNQLRVTVTRDVGTSFLKLVGVTSAEIDRDATAEFTSSLPMGSPEQHLGRDPERNIDPGFWLSVSSRGDEKIGGDRYQSRVCRTDGGTQLVYNCDGNVSTEYASEGYEFSVELNGPVNGDLVIEAYDPVHSETNSQACTSTTRLPQTGPRGYDANIATIQARYPSDTLAADRYRPGDTIYCNGDVGGGSANNDSTANVTTFIVRDPDGNALDSALDPDTGCTRQFRAINLRRPDNSGDLTIYEILAGAAGNARADAAQATFRQWVNLCTVPSAVVQGWIASGQTSVTVQVRSNAALNQPFVETADDRNGRNHFALRAGYGSATAASAVSVHAEGKLPLHNGSQGPSTTRFFLTRVPSGNSGRTLNLDFYDIGDAAGKVDLTIVDPINSSGLGTCTFTRFQGNTNNSGNSDVGLGSATASGCTISGMTNNQYNGRLTNVQIPVPTGYTCVPRPGFRTDCWIQVLVTYRDLSASQLVFDHTVWDAGVIGDPVRLIE